MFRVVAEDEALRGLGPSEYLGLAGAAGPAFRGFRESLQSVTAGSRAMFGTVTRPWRMPRVTTGSTQSPLGRSSREDGWLHAKRFKDLFASIVEMKC